MSASQSFRCNFNGGSKVFHVAFIKHELDFDVTADVAIRIDAVEDLIERVVGRKTNAKRRLTYTVGAELGNIQGTGQLRWTVESADSVPTVARNMFESFKSVALPYYENASSPEKVYELLNSEGSGSRLHSPISSVRAKTLLALAFLLGRKQDIDLLEKKYVKLLSDLKDPALAGFIDFANSIKML